MRKIASIAVFILFVVYPVYGQTPSQSNEKYVPGHIIVKFKDTVSQSVEDMVRKGQPLAKSILGNKQKSNSLDRLINIHKATKATPLFRQSSSQSSKSGRNIVQLKSQEQQTNVDVKKRFAQRSARTPKNTSTPDLYHVYDLELAPDANVLDAVEDFTNDPNVEYAQPNYIIKAHGLPNDTFVDPSSTGKWMMGTWGQTFEDLWGLKKIEADQAWVKSKGQGIVVAVIDTGVDYNHPDLKNNMWVNPDPHEDGRHGWNFIAENKDPMDDAGHGTHVAGIIAAEGNNKLGVIGVAPLAKIMAIKALDNLGDGTMSVLSQAIVYAAEQGADVINNSWGCDAICPNNPVAEDAVKKAYALGATVVFSSGNSLGDAMQSSPQNRKEVITVGATDSKDALAFYSNTGASLCVVAPGGFTSDILSLLSHNKGKPIGMHKIDTSIVDKDYYLASGTSMAAPHVAGLVALLMSKHPEWNAQQIRAVIAATSDKKNKDGWDVNKGYGRINATKALEIDFVPEVRITQPPAMNLLPAISGKTIKIKGTIKINAPPFKKRLRSYALFYRPLSGDGQWQLIKQRPLLSSTENTVLGELSFPLLPGDAHLLRLVVTLMDGSKFEDITWFPSPIPKITTDLIPDSTSNIGHVGAEFRGFFSLTSPDEGPVNMTMILINGDITQENVSLKHDEDNNYIFSWYPKKDGRYRFKFTATNQYGFQVSRVVVIQIKPTSNPQKQNSTK